MQMEMLRQALAMQSLEQQPKAEGEGGTNTLEARVQQLEFFRAAHHAPSGSP